MGSDSVNAIGNRCSWESTSTYPISNGGQFLRVKRIKPTSGARPDVLGAIAGAKHVHTLAKEYGVPVILHTDHAAKKLLPWVDGLLEAGENTLRNWSSIILFSRLIYLKNQWKKMAKSAVNTLLVWDKLGMTLEIEIGITGGEEDGVDNSDVDESRLYTQPSDVLYVYDH